MRLVHLHLDRFGAFTDVSLDLHANGLTVVQGANEAGKSTAMAAIQQLFYGIPVRSPHAFLHPMASLRIGATLRDEEGHELTIVRLKKASGTLRDASDAVLDESVLQRLLRGVSADVYASLFAIGHAEISSGGEALLRSDGELGRALFGAGTGLTRLNRVLATLERRADDLFKASGTRPLINASIAAVKASVQEVKALARSAPAAARLEAELAQAEEALRVASARGAATATRQRLVQRVRAARPLVVEWRRCMVALTALSAEGPMVTAAVAAAQAGLLEARQRAVPQKAVAEREVEEARQELARLQVDDRLLTQATLVGELVEELGHYRTNLEALPELQRAAAEQARELTALHRTLPARCPRGADGLPLVSADVRAALARHGRAWPALDSTARSAQRLLDEGLQKQRAVAGELARLSVPPDVTALQRALERIRPDGRLEVTRDTRVRESVVIEDEARATLLALGLGGDLAGADALSLPDGATVDAVDGARRDAEARLAECTTEHDRLRRETEAYRRDLAALLATADPPSLQALHEARSRRDAGWRHVRGTWLGGGDSVLASQWAGEMPLPDAFELATNGADQIADRLRTEADTVATRALLEQNLAASDAALTEAGVWLGQAEDTVAEARAAWASLWTPLGLVPSGRVEMDRRLAQLRGVVANSARARAARADAAELAALVDRHREDLRALLIDSGVSVPDRLSLAALLDMATETCRRAESLRMQRSGHEQSAMTLADACRQYDADVTATAGAVARWREEWRGLVPAVGLSPEATPEELDAVLGLMPKLEAVHDAHEAVRQQIAGIEERNLAIHRRVAAVLAALPAHADLDATQPELAIAELQARVRRAQETDTGRRVQAARLARWQAEADTATRELGRCTVELATMARTAGLADEPALAAAVARTQQHETLGREARRLDEQLVAATGASPEDVAREVDAFQGMDVEAELATLTLQLTEVESHRNTCAVTVGRLQQERAQADASDAAAEAAAREEEALAALALQSDEYVRVALARALLQEEMAAYRDQHQGPVLARAGELFAELTLGRYRGIDTDVTDKGVVQLLARAGSGATVDVAGLSTGTRDQLYLALRLASLEQFAQQGRALPVILDDLFVHFDDQRTAAGLRVLAGLAGHMQVLLFTHHERVAAQARTELDTSQVTVLQLSGKA